MTLQLNGIDFDHISTGSFLCTPEFPIPVVTKLRAQIVVFKVDMPIFKGASVVFHFQMINEAAFVSKLVSCLDRNTGECVSVITHIYIHAYIYIIYIHMHR